MLPTAQASFFRSSVDASLRGRGGATDAAARSESSGRGPPTTAGAAPSAGWSGSSTFDPYLNTWVSWFTLYPLPRSDLSMVERGCCGNVSKVLRFCYKMPPPTITIEEDEEELVICLHLPLSETSPMQRSSARSRIQSLTQELSEIGSMQPADLSAEQGSPSNDSAGRFVRDPGLPSRRFRTFGESGVDVFSRETPFVPPDQLDFGLAQPRRGPAKEDIVAILDRAIRDNQGRGGLFTGLLRGIGNLEFSTGINPRSRTTISEQLARLSGSSTAEVHLRLLLPFIGEPGIGKDFARAIVNDFRIAARAGDVEGLTSTVELLGGAEETLNVLIKSQSAPTTPLGDTTSGPSGRSAPGAGRGLLVVRSDRARKGVKDLKRQAELNLLFAKRLQEAP